MTGFTAKASDLKKLAKALRSSLIDGDDFVLRLENGEVGSEFIDPAHVMFARLRVPAEAEPDARAEWGCNLGRFKSIVDSIPNGDVTVTPEDSGGIEKLKFVSGYAAARMSLVDTRNLPAPKVPPLGDDTVEITLPAAWLLDAAKAIAKHSDHCYFVASNGAFVIESSAGGGHGAMSSIALRTEAPPDGDGRAMFSIDYLTEIFNAIGGEATLRWADDYPLTVTTPSSKHILSPRIESE